VAFLTVTAHGPKIQIGIRRSEVEACDITSVAGTLDSFIPELCDLYRNRVDFFVTDYDDDPREVWDIPEVRAFYGKLFRTYKGMFYWANTKSQMFGMLALLTYPTFRSGGGATITMENQQLFLAEGFVLLNDYCREKGLSPDPANRAILEWVKATMQK